MTRYPSPPPSDLGPNGAPDQSPKPSRWPVWLAIGLIVFLVLISLAQS